MTLDSTIPTPAPVAVAATHDAAGTARVILDYAATTSAGAPSFVKNFGFLVSGDLVAKVFTFVAFAFLARTLGPESFGRVEFALAFTFVLSLVIDFGFGLAGARDAAAAAIDAPHLRAIVTRVVSERLWFMIPCLAAALVFIFAAPAARDTRGLLLLFACSLLPAPFILQWAFQGRGLMQYVGIAQTLRFAVFAAIVLLGVRTAADLWLVAAAEIAAVAACAAFCAIVCRRLFGFLPPLLPRAIDRAALVRTIPIGLSQLSWAVKYVFVTVLVGFLMTKEDVGQFGVALRVTVALHAFVALYFYNVLPAAAAAHARSSTALDDFIGGAVRGSTWIAIPAACLAVLLAPTAVRVVFGHAYAAAAPALQVQVVALALALLSAHFRATLIACHRSRAELLSTATGAAVQIAVTLICYRRYGLRAAAWGMFAGELCTLVLSVGFAGRGLLATTRLLRQLLPHAAVIAAVIAVIAALAGQPPWLRATLALLTVAAGITLLDRASLFALRNALVIPHRADPTTPHALTNDSVNP